MVRRIKSFIDAADVTAILICDQRNSIGGSVSQFDLTPKAFANFSPEVLAVARTQGTLIWGIIYLTDRIFLDA